jgi:chromate transporter
MPGPASSQVGILLGYLQRGHAGALAAWLGFTLPSALLMMGMGVGILNYGTSIPHGVLHGLEIVALAVIAQAIWLMTRTLCTGPVFLMLVLMAVIGALSFPGAGVQFFLIITAALIGKLCRMKPATQGAPPLSTKIPKRDSLLLLFLFLSLLVLIPLLNVSLDSDRLKLFDAFFRSGAFVFGGGHVVLPLLQAELVPNGWITNEDFMAGYGAVQAMPGPLFTLAAYLGALSTGNSSAWLGGLIALIAIFLPAYLLILGGLPFWSGLNHFPAAQSALAGINAAVVGLLIAAFFQPVWTIAIVTMQDLLLALLALMSLVFWKLPVILVVLLCAITGMTIS